MIQLPCKTHFIFQVTQGIDLELGLAGGILHCPLTLEVTGTYPNGMLQLGVGFPLTLFITNPWELLQAFTVLTLAAALWQKVCSKCCSWRASCGDILSGTPIIFEAAVCLSEAASTDQVALTEGSPINKLILVIKLGVLFMCTFQSLKIIRIDHLGVTMKMKKRSLHHLHRPYCHHCPREAQANPELKTPLDLMKPLLETEYTT